MTDPRIEDLEMSDTDYAHLLAQGYDSDLSGSGLVIDEGSD